VRKSLRKEAFYPHPPEKVWVALTNRKAIAEWLMPNNFEPEVGRKFRLQCDPFGPCAGLNECEVLEVEAPRRLVYSWINGMRNRSKMKGEPMVITWTLIPEDGGTRLVLEHVGLEVLDWFTRGAMNFGWGTMLKTCIPKVLKNVADDLSFTPGAIPLSKRCYKVKTLPDDITY
jgi:uncharacterized protein YndB with AHSA1/START domain